MCDTPKDHDKQLDLAGQSIDEQAQFLDYLTRPGGPGLPKSTGSWTVAVFMIADDTLRPFAERDLQELAKSGSRDLQVLTQVHWEKGWKGDVRPIVFGGSQFRKPVASPAGAFSTMEAEFADFLATVDAGVQSFKTTATAPHNLMIVLWGHAFDIYFGGVGVDGMTIQQIKDRLVASGLSVNILGLDACETNRVEVVSVLEGVADRIIGSQIGVPFSGWPYHLIINEIVNNPGIPVDALGNAILDRFYESYRPPRVTLTMVDGRANYSGLKTEIDALANAIGKSIGTDAALFPAVLDAFLIARRDRTIPAIDLKDFCEQLSNRLAPGGVTASVVSDVTGAAGVILGRLPGSTTFVHAHRRRGPGVNQLHGLGFSPYAIMGHSNWDAAKRARVCAETGWPPAPFWQQDERARVIVPLNRAAVAATLPTVERRFNLFTPRQVSDTTKLAVRDVLTSLRTVFERLRALGVTGQ